MRFLSLVLGASLCISTGAAATITVGGGTTTVELVPDVVATLTGAGLSISALGSGSLMGTTAMFPITGGSIDTDTNLAMLFHQGSGLRFSSGLTFLDLRNFVIDVDLGTETGVLTGDAEGAVDVSDVPIFNIGPGFELSLTTQAAGALTSAFGLPDLAGTVVGTASADPAPVPEPSSLLAAAGGLGLLGWRVWRQRSGKMMA